MLGLPRSANLYSDSDCLWLRHPFITFIASACFRSAGGKDKNRGKKGGGRLLEADTQSHFKPTVATFAIVTLLGLGALMGGAEGRQVRVGLIPILIHTGVAGWGVSSPKILFQILIWWAWLAF